MGSRMLVISFMFGIVVGVAIARYIVKMPEWGKR